MCKIYNKMLHQSHSSNSRDNGNDQDMIHDQLESILTTVIRLHYQKQQSMTE